MSLTDKQKSVLAQFLVEHNGDFNWLVDWSLKTPAQRKSEVVSWWNARKSKLLADKATLNQEFLNAEKAKLDEQLTDGDDLVINL